MDQLLQYTQQLPIEIQQLAEANHLGSLANIYRRKISGPIARIVGLTFVLLLLIGPIIFQWFFLGYSISNAIASLDWPVLLPFASFNLFWYGVIILTTVVI